MAELEKSGSASTSKEGSNGLSQFLGKVLEQLSLTSWMPAGMLVGVGALLVALHVQVTSDKANGDFDLSSAVAMLTDNILGTTIFLLVAVILTATITQAFSFGAIRLLEGYWDTGPLSGWFMRWRARRWSARRDKLRDRLEHQRKAAFRTAVDAIRERDHNVSNAVLAALEDIFNNTLAKKDSPYAASVVEAAKQIRWENFASPGRLHECDRTRQRLKDFPARHRILPTKLGNVLRAREDSLKTGGIELEGLVMRRYAGLPSRLLDQHDQFRDRLDMYCTFVPIFVILALLSAVLLGTPMKNWIVAGITSAGFLLLACLSYRAAIASARGYGVALSAIAATPTTNESRSAQPATVDVAHATNGAEPVKASAS